MKQKDRDEDSGLHDIRSLASSTKARLSSRRSTQNPITTDEDIIASSSAGWKAVALPEPAKMVSLPELASLPTKAEIERADRASREQVSQSERAAVAAAPGVSAAPEAAPMIGARIAAQQSSGKGKTIAIAGLGIAAAAGAVFFFAMNKEKTDSASTVAAESKALPQAPTMTAKQLPPPPAPKEEPPPPPPAPVEVAAAAPEPAATESKPATKGDGKKDKVHKVEIRDTPKEEPKQEKPAPAPKEEVKKGGEEGEPSFDALLKEAGVTEGGKKETKPKLDKKSLSGGDIKTGMGSVAAKAQGCYAGTQGTAAVKLTVAPSGKVQKATVTGVFAGTPVAACVEKAVMSATFPEWDGGPQTFGYSYLLAE